VISKINPINVAASMIKISGSVHRSFIFPASVDLAFSYYSDLRKTLEFLPHISLIQQYSPFKYRMQYKTVELGIYEVILDCDLEARIDQNNHILEIRPIQGFSTTAARSGLYSLAGQGYFTSKSVFRANGLETAIDYGLRIEASLHVPLALRFVPSIATNRIARIITQRRMVEIADGFINNTIRAFPALVTLTH